jgi:hypothetical protein
MRRLRKVYDQWPSRAGDLDGIVRERQGYYHYSYSVVRGCGGYQSTSTHSGALTARALLYGVLGCGRSDANTIAR